MKRTSLIVLVVIILFTSLMMSSCSTNDNSAGNAEFFIPNPENLHSTLLEEVVFDYKDLDLTEEEIEAIQVYQKYGNVLRAANYNWSGKGEYIEFNGTEFRVGVNMFELEVLEKVFDINIAKEYISLETALEGIETGAIDMIPGVYATESISSKGDMLSEGSTTDFVYAYTRDEDIIIDDITDFDGLKIGIIGEFNYFDEEVLANYESLGIDAEIISTYSKEYQLMQALKLRKIDVAIHSFSTDMLQSGYEITKISHLAPENSSNILFSSYNAYTPYLISAIQKLYNYGTFMQDITEEYMDEYGLMVIVNGDVFTNEETSYIRETHDNPIVVKGMTNAAPFIYQDEAGEWDGISYRIWDRVAKSIGLGYDLQDAGRPTLTNSINQLGYEGNEVEISALIPMTYTDEKSKYFLFSSPLLIDNYVVVGRHDSDDIFEVNDLANEKVGVATGYTSTDVLKSYLPHKDYASGYVDNAQLLEALLNETIDYFVLSQSEYNQLFYYEQNYDITSKYTLGEMESSIAFSSDKDGEILQSIFEKVYPFILSNEIKQDFLTYDTNISKLATTATRTIGIISIIGFIVIITSFLFFANRIRKSNKRVTEMAYIDNVTTLPNRTAFYKDNTIARGALMYVEVDNFKKINDVYGHDIGDKFIYQLGQTIKEIADVRHCIIYAMSADSLLILDRGDMDSEEIVAMCSRIIYEAGKSIQIYDVVHTAELSIGIAIKKDEQAMDELFKKADMSLTLAKAQGEPHYVIASDDAFTKYKRRQMLEDQLTQISVDDAMDPYYLPKIDIRDGRIIGAEALARWYHKDHGMIYPKEFIPVLEEIHAIGDLDISMLRKACRDFVDWRDRKLIDPAFIISVNLSLVTIEDKDIVYEIKELHSEVGIPYRSLEVEIKEEAFINSIGTIRDKLMQIARLGVNISIDDFTADHSTMTKIAQLPINIVKISQDLLTGEVTKDIREKYELISTLARNLNIGLIVEGVENMEQVQFLKDIPIYRVQGHFYSEPMKKEKAEEAWRLKYILKY